MDLLLMVVLNSSQVCDVMLFNEGMKSKIWK